MEEQESLIQPETSELVVYPEKPVIEESAKSLVPSLVSVGLFIGLFYLVFDWEFSGILLLVGVLFIHELGHFLAMKAYNYKDVSMFFVPFFGAFVSGSKEQLSQRQSAVVLLAGPLPGIVIGSVVYYYAVKYNHNVLFSVANFFLFLNLFNLLPVMPLDGGRFIKCIYFESSTLISNLFSYLSIGALLYYAFTSQSYLFLLVPGLLMLQLLAQSQLKKTRKAVQDKGLTLNKSYDELSNEEYWLIRDEIGKHIPSFRKYITPGTYETTENEFKVLEQVKAVIQKEPVKDLSVAGKIVFTLIWIISFILPVVVIGLSRWF
jgi:stage IV sporulation protein FB